MPKEAASDLIPPPLVWQGPSARGASPSPGPVWALRQFLAMQRVWKTGLCIQTATSQGPCLGLDVPCFVGASSCLPEPGDFSVGRGNPLSIYNHLTTAYILTVLPPKFLLIHASQPPHHPHLWPLPALISLLLPFSKGQPKQSLYNADLLKNLQWPLNVFRI